MSPMHRLTRARTPQGQARGSVARDPARLEAFSDGVFAITITLLVLEYRSHLLLLALD